MSIAVYMPELGESVTEGTVTRWLKNVGDTVTVDEPLVEVATDKVDTEIPSPVAGVLLEICAWEDDTISVGGLLARIGDSDEMSNLSIADTAAFDLLSDTKAPTHDEATKDIPTSKMTDVDNRSDSVTVILPNLGESVTSGVITHWCKQISDTIHADEPLVEIATDKVDTEIPSPLDGRIVEIYATEDDTVKVGAPLALISPVSPAEMREYEVTRTSSAQKEADLARQAAESRSELKATKPMPIIGASYTEPSFADVPGAILLHDSAEMETPPVEKQVAETSVDIPSYDGTLVEKDSSIDKSTLLDNDVATIGNSLRGSSDHSYISPLVRKLAAEHGIDLATVKGTGLGGRIRKPDILAAAAEKQRRLENEQLAQQTVTKQSDNTSNDPEPTSQVQTASVIRQTTAESVLYAARNTAVVSQTMEVDLTHTLHQLSSKGNAGTSLNCALRGAIAVAVSRALRHHPQLNASYSIKDNNITYHSSVDLSIGIDTTDGLISPVIHNAEKRSVSDMIVALSTLKERALSDSLTPTDLSGGTFTLISTSASQLLWETPLVIPPQCAALSMGSPVQRPTVFTNTKGSSIDIRAMSYLTLSFDTCLIDGPLASRFLADIKNIVEDATFLDDLNAADVVD